MVWTRPVVDLLGMLYPVSLVLYFIDFVRPRRTLNRVALLLLFAVFLLLTVVIVAGLVESGHIPIYNRFDLVLTLCWIILLVAIVLDACFRVGLVLLFANLLAFVIVMYDVFARPLKLVDPYRTGDLLALHIATAVLSYTAFAFAFVFSLMYLIQEAILRKKRWNRWYFRLPDLEMLELYSFGSVSIGLPLLLVSMALGFIWSKIHLDTFLFWDPKILATLASWLLYAVYLAFRLRSGWGGRRLALYGLLCFAAVIINFIVVGDFSVFHNSV